MSNNEESHKSVKSNVIKRNHTFLTGIYLGINAIKDAYLIVDGPDCAYKKSELFEKNHDFYSNLFDHDGYHRICSTVTDVNLIINDRIAPLTKLINKIAKFPKSQSIFITSEPMAQLIGMQYDMVANESQKTTNKPIIDIPYNSVNKDWLDAYESFLEQIAKKLNLTKNKRKNNKIGIVGYLFDRNEGDHHGNIQEIKRWMEALGLEVPSIWLSGSEFSELSKIEEAEYIISLPYARKPARTIANKTGAKIIELDLPFGIDNTKQWLLKIAEITDRTNLAEDFIEQELKETIPILEWIVPTYFQGKTTSLVGDPHLVNAMKSALEELDLEFSDFVVYSNNTKTKVLTSLDKDEIKRAYFEIEPILRNKNNHFVIGNSSGLDFYHIKYIEFGFPNFGNHALSMQPFFGFKGFINFLNRIINKLSENQ